MKDVKYDQFNYIPSKLHKNNIDRMAIESIDPSSHVLDIGCATGFVGEYLINEKKCRVVGVDNAKAELTIAKTRLSQALLLDIEDRNFQRELKKKLTNEKFDVILLMSIIEHVKSPDTLLNSLKPFLKPAGRFIVTTPNVAHWTVRISLLFGNFDYTKYGILDETHLRLFTLKSFTELFNRNKFIVKKHALDSVGGGYPKISNFLSRYFPGLFAYQILIVAKLKK